MNDIEILKINGTTVGNFRDTRYTSNTTSYYGENDEAAATTARTVAITDYQLKKGNIVVVTFDNSLPAGATLNVTATGAKPIYYKGAALPANTILAGDTATFIYTGTAYLLLSIDINIDVINALRSKTVYTE